MHRPGSFQMTWRRRVAAALLDGRTLSRRILNRELGRALAGARAGSILDVGGASGVRYRGIVRSSHYWTVDLQPTNRPSIVGDAHRLPIADGSIDLVLCIQVLEHCARPDDVV